MSRNLVASETIVSEPRLRYHPVMIARLLLSLRKAGGSREYEEPTTHATMRFAERRGGVSMGDEIHLDTLATVGRDDV